MLKKADFLWLLAFPLYLLIGTLRHEASHALVGWLEGATITEFVFWPTTHRGRLLWGYVSFSGSTSWLMTAAPYVVDLLTFGLFFWLCIRYPFQRRWLWLNAVIIGIISPLVNSTYNYQNAFRGAGDIGHLLDVLPPTAVHAYMIGTIALYAIGLWLVFKAPNARR
jgi:hypothetical protein